MKNNEDLSHIRHSLAHLLGAAVLELYPEAKLTIGPAVEDGFYYDVDFGNQKITEESLAKIENKMREIFPTWKDFAKEEVMGDPAKTHFKNNEYKKELIGEVIKKQEPITFYTSGTFTDLCRGGHVENMQTIPADAWKLDRIAGAYWRGDEKNKMLTRIYGLAFESKEKLDAHLTFLEEVKKRDSRVLGKQLKLFTISPLIGPGLPVLQPNGMAIRVELEKFLWELHSTKGYQRVWTPHITKKELYVTSGHWDKFADDLFHVKGGSSSEEFVVKPMNCPHHMQIFADNQFSYRDMPVRYFEPATVYRDEKSGQLGGLLRVRAITQDDGHLFCRVSQIAAEVNTIVSIIKEFYTTFGLMSDYWVRLSVRGEDKSMYLGGDDVWNKAEAALEEAAKINNLNYKPGPGEAAFYGPKLDFMFKDAIGREWQLATIQCDFNLPERFDLSFINEQGEKERPVVIHRAISGSIERFMGVMIEHFAGAFPVWLSPVQVKVLPVSDKFLTYAEEVLAKLKLENIRVTLDDSKESLGKKIRDAKMEKTPYLLIIGEKEVTDQTITVEKRGSTEKGTPQELADFVETISTEIKNRSL